MDEKNVEVVIEAFGNKGLKKTFSPEELRGKSIEQILLAVVNQPWQGTDNMTLHMIKDQIAASGGYTARVCKREVNQPIKFVPIGRDSPALPYIQTDNQLRIDIIGDHVVGKYCKD